MKIDGFLVAMLVAVGLAFAAPELGASGGPLHLGTVTTIGIAVLFFLHGAALSPQALRIGAANWRLHLFVQASTFVLFPLIGFAIFLLGGDLLALEMRLGLFYLCALSSTVSSSVAMTALGRGNVPAAIFNATLSGLLGMILTPFLVHLVMTAGPGELPLLPAIGAVLMKLLLPFALGQLLRPLVGPFIARHRGWISKVDRGVIVLIVYAAFCESTAAGLWSRYDPLLIAGIAGMVSALLALVLAITTLASRALDFSREDEVAAVFCGSKKSLANGAPIATVLFGASPVMGMIMLPLLLYHQLQLIVCAMLARRYAARAEAGDKAGRTVTVSAGAE